MTTDQPTALPLRLAMATQSSIISVKLTGALDVSSVALFHRSLDPLLAAQPESVVIDLRDLDVLDGAGATALARVAEAVAGHAGTLVVRHASGGVERVLSRCGFGSLAGVEVC